MPKTTEELRAMNMEVQRELQLLAKDALNLMIKCRYDEYMNSSNLLSYVDYKKNKEEIEKAFSKIPKLEVVRKMKWLNDKWEDVKARFELAPLRKKK